MTNSEIPDGERQQVERDSLGPLAEAMVEPVSNVNGHYFRADGSLLVPAVQRDDPSNEAQHVTDLLLKFFRQSNYDLEYIAHSDQEIRRREALEIETRRKTVMFPEKDSKGIDPVELAKGLVNLSKSIPLKPKSPVVTHYMLDQELANLNNAIRPSGSAVPIDLWVIITNESNRDDYRAMRFAGLLPRITRDVVVISPIVEDIEGNRGRVPSGFRIIGSDVRLYTLNTIEA